MKLIIITGSPEATSKFAKSFALLPFTSLISNDIHELIHARRSANPPQYALADVSTLTISQRSDIHRHFPDFTATDVEDGLDPNESLYAARSVL